jgi:hypothetical protein
MAYLEKRSSLFGLSVNNEGKKFYENETRTQHEIGRLMLTQIIAGDALEQIADKMRDECRTTFKTSLQNGVVKKEDGSASSTSTHLRDLIGGERTVKMSDIIDQVPD